MAKASDLEIEKMFSNVGISTTICQILASPLNLIPNQASEDRSEHGFGATTSERLGEEKKSPQGPGQEGPEAQCIEAQLERLEAV